MISVENPSLAFEISVGNYIKIKRTIMVTENTDLYSDLANYFSYRKIAKTKNIVYQT